MDIHLETLDEIATRERRLPIPYIIPGSDPLPSCVSIYCLQQPLKVNTPYGYRIIPSHSFVIYISAAEIYHLLVGKINNIPVISPNPHRNIHDISFYLERSAPRIQLASIDHRFHILAGTPIIHIGSASLQIGVLAKPIFPLCSSYDPHRRILTDDKIELHLKYSPISIYIKGEGTKITLSTRYIPDYIHHIVRSPCITNIQNVLRDINTQRVYPLKISSSYYDLHIRFAL